MFLQRLKKVSNETPNDVSVVRHEDVLVSTMSLHLYNVAVVCLHHVSELHCCDGLKLLYH